MDSYVGIDPEVSEALLSETPVSKLAYSKKEAARTLSIGVRTLDYLIGSGELEARRVGRRVIIPHGALVRFLRGDHPSGRKSEDFFLSSIRAEA